MQQATVTNLYCWDTVYSADSVEWCPIDSNQDILVCGTYQVEPSDQEGLQQNYRRLGCLYLFKVDISGLNLLEQHDLPAVLDLKWCHVTVNDRILLAVANALGEILIYELSETDYVGDSSRCSNMLKFVTKKSIHCKELDSGETLVLSMDWCTARKSMINEGVTTNEASLVVSDSRGWITVLTVTHIDIVTKHTWKAHEFEAWIAAYDYWSTNIIYSGGDDSKLHMFDLRVGTSASVQSSKAHNAGVTSLHCSAATENWLVSGSYDENLRSWDTRSLKSPIMTTFLKGGVWRLKWDPRYWRYLLAACMSNGFQVVGCPDQAELPSIVTEYQEHKSLAYGADWCHLPVEESQCLLKLGQNPQPKDAVLIATCSFYDHKMDISYIYNFPS